MTPLPLPLVWAGVSGTTAGFLHVPPGQVSQLVVLVSGGTQTRVGAHRQLWAMATDLAEPGVAVLRFDRPGCGDSAGANTGFEQLDDCIRDAVSAAIGTGKLSANVEIMLLGHCDGATAALLAAGRGLDVAGLILLNPWARTADIAAGAALGASYAGKLGNVDTWRRVISGKVDVRGALRSIWRGLRAQLHRPAPDGYLADMARAWTTTRCPILVISGLADASAQEFAFARRSWHRTAAVQTVDIAGADHSFSHNDHHQAVVAAVGAWLRSRTQ